ncbi:MAG: hypothetical protein K1X75_02900 [Leptospirales bacterium]|nr:hypothetical protein [Leptospirales bacterium]
MIDLRDGRTWLAGALCAAGICCATCSSGGKLDPADPSQPTVAAEDQSAAPGEVVDDSQLDAEYAPFRARVRNASLDVQAIGFGCRSVTRQSWHQVLDQLEQFYRTTPASRGFGYSLGYSIGFVCATNNTTLECAEVCARHFQTNHMAAARQRFRDLLGVGI